MSAFKDKPGPGDIIAGVTVALVLIPQSIAYASLAGLPPIFGIYASILPPIIAAFFVSSPYLQTGPVAMTCLLTFGALASFAAPMSAEYIALAALLALMVGVVRVLIGFSRSGYIAYLMSQPVIAGFTAAAAALIIATQIPTFLGVEPTVQQRPGQLETMGEFFARLQLSELKRCQAPTPVKTKARGG